MNRPFSIVCSVSGEVTFEEIIVPPLTPYDKWTEIVVTMRPVMLVSMSF